MKALRQFLASFIAAMVLPPAALAGTCALCRQALASGGNSGLIQGFYWSILLIAGVPLILMAVAGFFIWRHHQRRHSTLSPVCDGSLSTELE